MSVYYSILSAVQSSVASVASNVQLRWAAKPLEGDVYPLCLVCPGEGGERVAKNTFPGKSSGGKAGVWYDYHVLVTYIDAQNQQAGAGLQAFLDAREAIRDQLYQTNAGPVPTTAFNIDLNPEAVQRLQAQIGTNYAVTGWLLSYTVAEQRVS